MCAKSLMDIESLIPKEVEDRDAYIKNVVFDKIKDCKLGVDFSDIIFKFKTDIPPNPNTINFIEVDGIELHNFGGDSAWHIVSNFAGTFLPKEYLLKEWKLFISPLKKNKMIHLKEKYTHYKNGKEYIPTSFCKIQDSGFWVDAVMYHHIDESDVIFVRGVGEFEEKFKIDEVKAAVEKTREELRDISDKIRLEFPVPPTNSSMEYLVFDVLTKLEEINKELSRIKEGV